jgi:hypothetical protein
MKRRTVSQEGSTLIMAIIIIAVLAMTVSAYYQTLVPKFRNTYQASSWQEALHGAEAGVDVVLQQLNTYAATRGLDPDNYPWTGWTTPAPGTNPNTTRVPQEVSMLPLLGGNNNVRVTELTVDVFTREGNKDDSTKTHNPWFRIRSKARADLPGKYVTSDHRDVALRRMRLGARKVDGSDDPHVSRTIEAVVRPTYRFSRAITVLNQMDLGNSENWEVDSYDSQDDSKSDETNSTAAGNYYPGSESTEVQENGDIASAKTLPAESPYGEMIDANGAVVRGSVQTTGGDNPTTTQIESVSDSQNVDQDRITGDFDEEILNVTAPTRTYSTAVPTGNPLKFTAAADSTAVTPTRYNVTGKLGEFTVEGPTIQDPAFPTDPTKRKPDMSRIGHVEIVVSGDLSIRSNGVIVIPPNVYCTVYVATDIAFGNSTLINANAESSRVPANLSIYGTGSTGTVTVGGNSIEILTVYAPNYSATIPGTVETIGSFVVKDFEIKGGGNGGFHYDEDLAHRGDITGWQFAGYIEDTRGEL